MRSISGTVYFFSDCHFGVPSKAESAKREALFVKLLDEIKAEADCIILLGDIFDFWFEYPSVVPRGHTRLLGKFAELSDLGVRFLYFTGNHDFWIRNYFSEEFGFEIIRKPEPFLINGKKVLIGHGDGLGPKDYSYKLMKAVFEAPVNRWLYARLHPNFSFWLAGRVSSRSRAANGDRDEVFHGEEHEWLIQFARKKLETEHFDYFIFGHRHLPLTVQLNEKSTYINTGEWIKSYSYAMNEGDKIVLKRYDAGS